jgi:putative ABC transport system permease protein
MIRNYFNIAWRSLLKNKISFFINVGGLALGITVALFIGLWDYDELSFNKNHKNYDRIAQVMTRGNDVKHGTFANTSLQYPLATELRTNYKDNFRRIVRASWVQDYVLSAGEKNISVTGQFMDEEAPAMLSLEMIKGDWNGLKDLNSIMIAASVAKRFFGDSDPVGQVMMINNKMNVKVAGVYEDLPLNSQFTNIRFLSTWDLWVKENDWIQKRAMNDWHNHFLKLYVEIQPGADFAAVSNRIKNIELDNIQKLDGYDEDIARNPQLFLQPMSKWHLYPINRAGETDAKPVRMVWTITIIGVFVLLLACINFMNLSTARSERRAKEVGIRKAIGSQKKQLIYQFFTESILAVIISFIFSCILVAICLPWFNDISAKQLQIPWDNPFLWIISVAFILISGILAGSYPALYLSSFTPVKVLKGVFRAGRFAALPRKALVVVQFTVSVALIISTIIIYRQVQIGKDRPVGYAPEGLIMIEMKSADFQNKYDLFRDELLKTGVVTNLSESMGKVTEVASGNNGFDWKGKDPNKEESFGTLAVTHEHGQTIGWEFVKGRDFSRTFASDSAGVVINESAAHYIGIENPVGETITWKWKDKEPKPYTIIGVIKDAVMESPYEAVEPTLFFVNALNGGVNWMNMRINPTVAFSDALPKIEAVFKKLVPAAPFDCKFVDEEYARKFSADERINRLAGIFAALAIFISCLGLFGLAAFVAEQNTRQVGVRKVLGASVFDLWGLLSKEFVVLVVISFLLASPLAYYFMNNWLQDYQYRTPLSWWIFIGAGSLALIIALLTVSLQTIKAALANPIKSLRTE